MYGRAGFPLLRQRLLHDAWSLFEGSEEEGIHEFSKRFTKKWEDPITQALTSSAWWTNHLSTGPGRVTPQVPKSGLSASKDQPPYLKRLRFAYHGVFEVSFRHFRPLVSHWKWGWTASTSASWTETHEMLGHPFIGECYSVEKPQKWKAKSSIFGTDIPYSQHREMFS